MHRGRFLCEMLLLVSAYLRGRVWGSKGWVHGWVRDSGLGVS